MSNHFNQAEVWTKRGGPQPFEYEEFNSWLSEVARDINKGDIDSKGVDKLRGAFGKALSGATLQGISLIKPRGYAGDFEVIDRVYQRSMTTNPELLNWDLYLVNTTAAKAVRNRKTYFLKLLKKKREGSSLDHAMEVLNIASGPARDVYEYLHGSKDRNLIFDCVEYDPIAILYAKAVCCDYLRQVNFIQKNAFRFTTVKTYPLIWSAGLFDYFDDNRFVFLTRRLYSLLAEGGELVIGNFSEDNPDQTYMEVLMEWELRHRSAETLTNLAIESGVPAEKIAIGQEPEGVNLFLHLAK